MSNTSAGLLAAEDGPFDPPHGELLWQRFMDLCLVGCRRRGRHKARDVHVEQPAMRTSKHIKPERDGQAIKAEYLQTDQWAIEAILRSEILTRVVVDPCCGDGRMVEIAKQAGYRAHGFDLYDWGYGTTGVDFLGKKSLSAQLVEEHTVFMNPPFSLACEFVERAMDLRARKIVCFQRSVWRESEGRREWWELRPPNRIYQCGNRAVCWYGTIPIEERDGGAYQPHSWFVWERDQPAGALQGTIWKTE